MQEGPFARPGPIGRVLRLLGGLLLGAGLVWVLSVTRPLQDLATGKLALLFLVLLYALGDTGTKAFGLKRRWFPHGIAVVLAVSAAVIDLFRGAPVPGPVVRTFIFVLLVYVLSVATISFLLAALLAVPG